MLRQILISLLVIAVSAAIYVFFVPGSTETLARFGITLPLPAGEPATAPQPGGGPAAGGSQPQGGAQLGGQGGGQAAGQRQGGRGAGRAMVVVTSPVVMGTINDKLTAIGEGTAASSVTVVSPANGTLAELLVRPGDIVIAGATIGHLDSEAERIAFERAQLAFDDARTALERTRELAGANNATTVQVKAADLAFNNARLALQNADLDLRRRTISTPFGGAVGLFQVSPGNTVTTQTVVTTVEDTSELVISFWVPERYAGAITPGMPVNASAVALPGVDISGLVSAVDNRIDSTSRTLKVEARVDNAAGRLRPGMSFSVTMSFAGEAFPTVDPLAIQWSSAGAFLWRYADETVERVPVEIIQRNSDGVLVKADLSAGDQVVTQGVQQLTAGSTVRLLDAPAASGPGGSQGGERAGNRQSGNPS
ncbi:MAG: efflux RND transporter periplasmic adaptor subunit [Devosia sp.]|nr:efflux RND transporter periplasmic adaptor subunit [Devosia sp.]